MFLEDARAAVVVQVVRVRLGDVAQSLGKVRVRKTLVQRVLKHLQYTTRVKLPTTKWHGVEELVSYPSPLTQVTLYCYCSLILLQ